MFARLAVRPALSRGLATKTAYVQVRPACLCLASRFCARHPGEPVTAQYRFAVEASLFFWTV